MKVLPSELITDVTAITGFPGLFNKIPQGCSDRPEDSERADLGLSITGTSFLISL